MNGKGYTLIEVILAIAIFGLLAAAFLPLMTFSYTNLIGAEKFTEAMLEDQSIVEEQIDELRFENPADSGSDYVEAFGVNIPVHLLSINTTSSGQVKLYLPQQTVVPKIPIIKSPPIIIVRNNSGANISPQPTSIHIFNDPYKLFVNDVDITDATKNEHLMNVYRWYTSAEISNEESASEITDDYVVAREWNEAKTVVPYSEALEKGFIPNMKEYNDSIAGREPYNELNYQILKRAYSFTDEQMINNFGNRYLKYGVTPFSLTGRMGKEELSNAIYIEAPRIEILSAKFDDDENKAIIEFNVEIGDTFSPSSILLNESLGEFNVSKDEESEYKLILEFTQPIDNSSDVEGNLLTRGAVISKDYGAISIWHNNYPNSEFTISSD